MDDVRKNNLGKISLYLATAGIIGTVILWLCFTLFARLTVIVIPISIFVLLFIGLEIIAFVTGIVGWCSPYGKAGFGVSVSLLLLTTFVMTFSVPIFKTVTYEDNRSPVVESVESRQIQSQDY
ncbi:MAG: hypothetical protein ACYS6K_18740 [Planctomycetota bacterium]|jgi:hypothetical protein